jgi:hypothetical protein
MPAIFRSLRNFSEKRIAEAQSTRRRRFISLFYWEFFAELCDLSVSAVSFPNFLVAA